MRRNAIVSVLAVAAVGACSSSNATGTTTGTVLTDSSFYAVVTGAVSDSITGPAVYQEIVTAAGADTGFAISLGLGTQTGAIVIAINIPLTVSELTKGNYALLTEGLSAVDSTFYAVGVLGPACSGCTPTAQLVAMTGNITLASVTAARIEGTFSFSGYESPASDPTAQDSVFVRGGFIANAGVNVIDTATGPSAGPCAYAECNDRVVPFPGATAALTASRVLVSNVTISGPASGIGSAVNTRSQRADR